MNERKRHFEKKIINSMNLDISEMRLQLTLLENTVKAEGLTIGEKVCKYHEVIAKLSVPKSEILRDFLEVTKEL